MKSEPDEASIDTPHAEGTLPWTGIRNYQARSFMHGRIRIGGGMLLYHSFYLQPSITGLAEVCSTSYPGPTQSNARSHHHDPASKPEAPRQVLVDVKFMHKCALIGLPTLRAQERLVNMTILQRSNCLSIMPIAPAQWRYITTRLIRDPK